MDDPTTPPPDEPDRDRVDALFDRLLEARPDERRRILSGETIDAAVRDRVRQLLELADDLPAELDEPVISGELVQATAAPETVGPYRVLGLVGVGAMGVVYQAEQDNPRRRVALKLMRTGGADGPGRQRFQREAALLGRLQHPGIAQIFESGTAELSTGPTAYIAMELVDGHPLTDSTRTEGLDLRSRVARLAELADAVHHAHLSGVIHRDLKPSNVLVTAAGSVKVIDFGVARALDPDDSLVTTVAGQVVGTLAYMSPEQVRGDAGIDARTDVYSLGVLAFELLSGALPHELEGATLATAAKTIAEQEARRLGALAPACRGDLEWVVGRALEKDSERRYQSAHDLARDLRRWLAHEPVEAGPVSSAYRLRRFARRHRVAVLGVAATFLALLIGGATATHYAIVNARLAEDSERLYRLSEARAAEIVRRTDPDLLDRALEEAASLYPVIPATVPAMERWLRDFGDPLAESLVAHRSTLAAWREEAAPYTDEQRRRDRETHPALAELERVRKLEEQGRAAMAGEVPSMPLDAVPELGEASLAEIEEQRRRLEAAVVERQTWLFDDAERQVAHDRLARLVERLEAFADPDGGVLESVRRRPGEAAALEAATVTGPEAVERWAAARQAIREHPRYGGLDLPPQIGLLPLREDPRSGLWEFQHLPSGEAPLAAGPDAVGSWALTDDTGIVLVLIPGGSYRIGAQAREPGAPHFDPLAQPVEGPVRDEALEPFFLSKYEMTIRQWWRHTQTRPNGYTEKFRTFDADGEPLHVNTLRNPVERISWFDAVDGLRRGALRLPSGSEWEAAARGGTHTPWWTGAEEESVGGVGGLPAGNLADALSRERGAPSHQRFVSWPDDWFIHAPVGSFPPNPFGLHDVIGNVLEFCSDRDIPGATPDVVSVRGGCYTSSALEARVTRRFFVYETDTEALIGVRPARSVEGLADGDGPPK